MMYPTNDNGTHVLVPIEQWADIEVLLGLRMSLEHTAILSDFLLDANDADEELILEVRHHLRACIVPFRNLLNQLSEAGISGPGDPRDLA